MKYEDIISLKVDSLGDVLEESIQLSKLTIFNLLPQNLSSQYGGCGVYIFKQKTEVMYVGKASSRCFAERIPSHFDSREEGWFNTLLKKLVKFGFAKTIPEAIKYAQVNLSLTLIFFHNDNKDQIGTFEKLCRLQFAPLLNSYSPESEKKFGSVYQDKNLVSAAMKCLIQA